MKTLLSLLFALVMITSGAVAQESVQVGDVLPPLPVEVPSGPNGTVVLVFRSADW